MLVYNNPKIRYVDMCKYIDDNIYNNTYDETKVYDYLCYIIQMLAKQNNLFKSTRDYEDFSIYMASKVFLRLVNKRQFEENSSLEKIKSVLNYIKRTINFHRYDYCNEFNLNEPFKFDDITSNMDGLKYHISRSVDELNKCEFEVCLQDVIKTTKKFVYNLPMNKSNTELRDIYISCLLTFLNSITLKRVDIQRINSFKRDTSFSVELLIKLYNEESQNIILYHLDSSMKPFITVLVRRIKRLIAIDLSRSTHTYIPEYINIQNLLLSNLKDDCDL